MKTIRIVLADDHSIVRAGTKALLAHEPFEVVGEASNGQEALELVQKLQPDIIIFDIEMPLLNGVNLARILTAQHPAVKQLVLTAHGTSTYLRVLLKYNIHGFLPKDSTEKQLWQAIEKIMAGKLAISDDIIQEEDSSLNIREMESKLQTLTKREKEVFELLLKGNPGNNQIAESLGLQIRNVENIVSRLYEKLELTRTEIAKSANKWQILLGIGDRER